MVTSGAELPVALLLLSRESSCCANIFAAVGSIDAVVENGPGTEEEEEEEEEADEGGEADGGCCGPSPNGSVWND